MHSFESRNKVGFLEWRDLWFCKVRVRSMRKLFHLSVFMPVSETVSAGLQD